MSRVYVCDRCGAIIKDRRKIRTVGIYDNSGLGKFNDKGDLCPECLKQLDLFMHDCNLQSLRTSWYKEE